MGQSVFGPCMWVGVCLGFVFGLGFVGQLVAGPRVRAIRVCNLSVGQGFSYALSFKIKLGQKDFCPECFDLCLPHGIFGPKLICVNLFGLVLLFVALARVCSWEFFVIVSLFGPNIFKN